MKPWKRVFLADPVVFGGATMEKDMFAAPSRDPLFRVPPK